MVIIFQSVFQKHNFLELLYLKESKEDDQIPLFNPRTFDSPLSLNPAAEDEEEDLKVLSITWNMGASEDKNLLGNLDNLFKNRLKGDFNNVNDKVDLILYTS